jgi:putative tricarboxylic transport membrane protein
MRRAELASGAIIAVLATAYMWLAGSIPLPQQFTVIGPRSFPYLIGVGMLISGVWLVLESWLSSRKRSGAKKWPDTEQRSDVEQLQEVEDEADVDADWRSFALMAGLILAYIVVLNYIGFYIATSALIFLAAKILGSRKHIRDATTALVGTFAIHLLFSQVLGVRLPVLDLFT